MKLSKGTGILANHLYGQLFHARMAFTLMEADPYRDPLEYAINVLASKGADALQMTINKIKEGKQDIFKDHLYYPGKEKDGYLLDKIQDLVNEYKETETKWELFMTTLSDDEIHELEENWADYVLPYELTY